MSTGYRIVVGVDGTENGARALTLALDEALLRGGEVTAVFAWRTPMVGVPRAFDPDELELQAKRILAAEVSAAAPPDGVSVTQLVAEGDPADSLLAACERADADLLVLGSRGRHGAGGLVFGSVALDCVVRAPCPVLVVKERLAAGDRRRERVG